MSKTREKKVLVPTTITREQAEEAFANYAHADAHKQRIEAMMDLAITKIREKYTDTLTQHAEAKAAAFELIQTYAINNREDFGTKKSMDLTHGLIGFRTGQPKLKTLRGFTWPSVLNLVKEFLPAYARVTEEVAKDKLLADRNVPYVADLFTKVGIMVDQDESFYVEPKKELAEA